MALKTERVIYVAKNFETGLADITASIRRNGVSVATGVALSEVANGRYQLVLAPATLSGYGGAGYYDFYIDSASKSAPAVNARWILANDSDDLEAHLGTIEGKVDIVDANVDSVKLTVEDTNTKVNDGTYGLSALKTLIDAVQSAVGSIQNNTRFVAAVPADMVRPVSGSTRYRIPIRLYDTSGNLEDPDSNAVAVSITDETGADRTSYLVGYVAGPVNATRIGVGVYYSDIDIPDTAGLEQLNFNFAYTEGAIALSAVRTTSVISDVANSGFALESTSQDILTDTADMQPRVTDIQTKVNDATYGLAAIKALIDTLTSNVGVVDTVVDSILAELANGTYGLANIKTVLDTKASQSSVNTIQTAITDDVKGTGFVQADDTLHQISLRTYKGGVAV